MKTQRIWILFTILVLTTLACATLLGGQDGDGDSNEKPADAGSEEGLSNSEGSSSQPEDSSAFNPFEILGLDDPGLFDGVEGVDSYVTSLYNDFEGTNTDGRLVTGTIRLDGATQSDPYESTLVFRTEGQADMGLTDAFTYTQITDMEYLAFSGSPCVSGLPGIQQNPLEMMLDFGGMLTGDVNLLGEEQVNGVDTYAYEITEENLSSLDSAGAGVEEIENGVLNVAKEGGYVVRLILEGSGKNEFLSRDPNLTGHIYYELNFSDFNQPVDIQIPRSCAGGEDAGYPIPLPEDAQDITQFGTLLTFTTGLSVEATAEFFQTELTALGCSEGLVSGSAEEGLIIFYENCPDGNPQLTIEPSGETTSVTVIMLP